MNEFGEQSRRLAGLFAIKANKIYPSLALIALTIVLLFISTPLLTLIYQIRGGQLIEKVYSEIGTNNTLPAYCGSSIKGKETETRQVNQAIILLQNAITYNPHLDQAHLLLARSYCLLGDYSNAVVAYRQYTQLRPANPLGHLELALAYETGCLKRIPLESNIPEGVDNQYMSNNIECEHDDLNNNLIREWKASGVTAHELFELGENDYDSEQYDQAMIWYERAIRLEPKNKLAWQKIGKICQRYTANDKLDLCSRFLAYNQSNILVDSGFDYPDLFTMWDPYEYSEVTHYNILECPDYEGEKCVSISITDQAPPNGAGIYQCVSLQQGRKYHYAAWLKVLVSPGSQWRPLYYQGNLSGSTSGNWLTNQYHNESQDWTYFEYIFSAPGYDQNMACFHPIRLQGEGQAWLRKPKLELLQSP